MAKSGKSKSRGERKQQYPAKLKPQDWTLGLSVVHPKAAGIDVGNEYHYVAVPPSLDPEPVRVFGCFTADLIALADWLKQCGIETVAMQSTGVYWMALYDILEERGMAVFLVNARDTKNMPGRKSDVQQCQWLLKLHVYGLLKNSFRPEEEIRVMRTIWRQRQQQIADASRCTQRMQKALTQMNLQLANVISDISGLTGQSIIGAILKGERDRQKLAQLRDPPVKASEEVIAKSLEGSWREDLLFVLKQEFESYQSFEKKIEECDEKLYEHLQRMEAKADPKTLPACKRNKRPHGNVPEKFDLREELYRITGVDSDQHRRNQRAEGPDGDRRSGPRHEPVAEGGELYVLAQSGSPQQNQWWKGDWARQTEGGESGWSGAATSRQHAAAESKLSRRSISAFTGQTGQPEGRQSYGT
jgi:hypothetical protein